MSGSDPRGSASSATASQLDLAAAGRLVGALQREEPSHANGFGDGALPRIHGYRTRRRIGRGGGGVVYEAVAEGSERPLAIKILCQEFQAANAARAWRELDLLSQLRLPVIPQVLDYGVHEGRLYIVTEFVDGQPLDVACLGPRPGQSDENSADEVSAVAVPAPEGHALLSLRDRVELLAKVADAVQVLHERGIIHRDLKPANILIDVHGSPVLLDLGIATALTGDLMRTLTLDGAPIGTPAFMAPEQARGERQSISTRSDIYALGATACYILTGQTPHKLGPGNTTSIAEALRRIASDLPRDPLELDPRLPRPLAAVLRMAIDPDPVRRYASAAALAADLRRWLRGEPVTAGVPTPLGRLLRWAQRYPIRAAAAVWATVLVVMIAANFIGIRVLYYTPHAVTIDSVNASRADLVTRSGHVLQSWNGGGPDTIRFAQLVPRPKEMGGGEVALIGWGHGAASEHTARLTAFEARRPDRLLWTSPSDADELVQPRPGPDEYDDVFQFTSALVADVFPELPGLEIISVHTHMPYSPVAIRVLDLDGQVLYEVWHDGHIYGLAWLSGPGLIVAAGVNCNAMWEDLGVDGIAEQWPCVVMGLRPKAGQRHGWIATPGGIGTVDAEWYRFISPPGAWSHLSAIARFAVPPTPEGGAGHTCISFATLDDGPPAEVSIILDGTGSLVSAFHTDRYPWGRRPALEEFVLLDRPASPEQQPPPG